MWLRDERNPQWREKLFWFSIQPPIVLFGAAYFLCEDEKLINWFSFVERISISYQRRGNAILLSPIQTKTTWHRILSLYKEVSKSLFVCITIHKSWIQIIFFFCQKSLTTKTKRWVLKKNEYQIIFPYMKIESKKERKWITKVK